MDRASSLRPDSVPPVPVRVGEVYMVGGGWYLYQRGDQFLLSPTGVGKDERAWPTQLKSIAEVAIEANEYLWRRV